jgi:hypothetical protein
MPMPPTEPLSPAERAALRVMHTENTSPYLPAGVCGQCDRPWPCWYVRLLDALDVAEAENARLNTAIVSAWDQTRETISTSYNWQPPAAPAEPEKNSHVH